MFYCRKYHKGPTDDAEPDLYGILYISMEDEHNVDVDGVIKELNGTRYVLVQGPFNAWSLLTNINIVLQAALSP